MHKIKYFPDVALFIMRLVTGIGFMYSIYPIADYLARNGMTEDIKLITVIGASILFVCSVFMVLGLYSRWASAVAVVTLLVAGFMSLPPLGTLMSEMTFDIFVRLVLGQLTNVLVPLSLWLLGTGRYSLDYKLWKRV